MIELRRVRKAEPLDNMTLLHPKRALEVEKWTENTVMVTVMTRLTLEKRMNTYWSKLMKMGTVKN